MKENQQVLVIEDDPDLGQILTEVIEGIPAQVHLVPSMTRAREELERGRYSLVLMDILLPDGDGLKLYAQLREKGVLEETPFIFLTGRNETRDKILAFQLGAEDFLVKPIDMGELKARLESKLKKRKGGTAKAAEETLIKKGDLRINTVNQKAFIECAVNDVRELPLTFSEFKLLNVLIHHEGNVMSREQLLTSVWGPNVTVVDRTVDKHISSLRQKMDPRSHYIQTVAKSGYRFAVPELGKNGNAA